MSPGMICRITALPAPAGEISALAAPERATFWSSGRRIWDRWVGTRCGAVLAALVIGIVLVGCWPLLTPLVATSHSLGFRFVLRHSFWSSCYLCHGLCLGFCTRFCLGPGCGCHHSHFTWSIFFPPHKGGVNSHRCSYMREHADIAKSRFYTRFRVKWPRWHNEPQIQMRGCLPNELELGWGRVHSSLVGILSNFKASDGGFLGWGD